MTYRDPYTGVERKARPHPSQSRLQRWWPAGAIALVALVVGYVEWHNAQAPAPHAVVSANQLHVAGTATTAAPSIVANPSATARPPSADELAQATAALAKASDQLSGTSNFLLGIAAVQALVLIGQIYLLGRQRRANRSD